MKKYFLLALIFTSVLSNIHSQILQEITSDLEGVMLPACTWISPGEDENLNVFLAGDNYIGNEHSIISQLNSYYSPERFKLVSTKLPAIYRGAAAAADYDFDKDDDIIVSGITSNNQMMMKLYRNEGRNNYVAIREIFTPLSDGSLEWGDFDNDEDLDILATGKMFNQNVITSVYRNDKGIFTEIETNIQGVYNGNATWGDFDNDNDLDILITGNTGNKPYTALYKYNGNTYERVVQQFLPLMNSAAAWGDFDNDMLTDFIISGEDAEGYPVCMIYKNEAGTFFKEIPVSIRPLMGCTIDVADMDKDGDPDIVMTGESLERPYSIVYENNLDFEFVDIMAGLPGVGEGDARWGDYDNDGDMDLVLSGLTICYDFIGAIYRNTTDPPEEETANNIFIHDPIPIVTNQSYYYYVFSSCFCDPTGGDNKAYHMYVSNVHKQDKRYQLNYKFNDLLLKQVPNWGKTDRGYRTSNGHETYSSANESRKQVIESYKATDFIIHEINW